MKTYHLVVFLMGIGLAVGILYLVRRDHIYIRQGAFWIIVAVVSLMFGMWPGLIDVVGGLFGIAYPPTLLLIAAIMVLLVKALLGDIALTKVRRDVRRLNQRIALIEVERPAKTTIEAPVGGPPNEIANGAATVKMSGSKRAV